MNLRIGQGWDLHRLTAGRPLILGGVTVPFDKGEDAHSDGDVLIHAVIDALLGAAALGDIGTLFPPEDAQWKDASSRRLLSSVHRKLSGLGWEIINLDSTVILERPKLRPHIAAVRKNLAADLALPMDCVSVKAKSCEKSGPVGRGEAVEAQASVLLSSTPVRPGNSAP